MTFQKYNCVIDYQNPIIDYSEKTSEKLFEKIHLFKPFGKAQWAYIYVCLTSKSIQKREFQRELNCQFLSKQLLTKHLQIY